MRTTVQASGTNPLNFGKRRPVAIPAETPQSLSDDLRLFLWTFAAGFLAVSIFLA